MGCVQQPPVVGYQPTYEELKPVLRLLKEFADVELPAYLWGIETEKAAAQPQRPWRYQPTYEELKRDSAQRRPGSYRRYQPTYEELKQLQTNQLHGETSLLPAYLWGIETTSRRSSRQSRTRYQPTYEELKPHWRKVAVLYQHGYQPTYEELKQEQTGLDLVNLTPLPAYLWGIETHFKRFNSYDKIYYQPTYEELKPTEKVINNPPCYQPTYEELKRLCDAENRCRILPAYLWGIETILPTSLL